MILVDSDVLIASLRGERKAEDWLLNATQQSDLATSAISVFEVAGGVRSHERREIVFLLSLLHVVPVTEQIAWKASEFAHTFRRSHSGINLSDYVIAGTASVHGFELATLNVRHFPMFPGLSRPFEP
jgi:predicted nucleic acid-binding protein